MSLAPVAGGDRLAADVRDGHAEREGVDHRADDDVAALLGLLGVDIVYVQGVVVHRDEAEEVVLGLGHGLGRPVLVDRADLELLEVAAVRVRAGGLALALAVVNRPPSGGSLRFVAEPPCWRRARARGGGRPTNRPAHAPTRSSASPTPPDEPPRAAREEPRAFFKRCHRAPDPLHEPRDAVADDPSSLLQRRWSPRRRTSPKGRNPLATSRTRCRSSARGRAQVLITVGREMTSGTRSCGRGSLARVAVFARRPHADRGRVATTRRDHGPQGRGRDDIHYWTAARPTRAKAGIAARSAARALGPLGVRTSPRSPRRPAHAGHEPRPPDLAPAGG